MRIGDVDFPIPLLDAQKSGSLVIFAGAGVSMPPPSNFPNFDELAEQVANGVLIRNDGEPVDHFLGRLVDQKLRVHKRVQDILSDPTSAPNSLHLSLLQLFEKSADIRLVTTNFDLHFTNASESLFGTEQYETYSAPALPLGDSFTGVVHLHGSVEKPPERLVLTDADFGRAYLTEGWARRFLQRMFAKYVILFVGYSHGDPVMNYLSRGLPPESEGPKRFAIVAEGDNDHWKYLGITPITYSLTNDADRHSALGVALSGWAERSRMGTLDQEQRIKGIVERPVPIDLEELDYIEGVLSDASTVRFFTRHAQGADWLYWIEGKGLLKNLFNPQAVTGEIDTELALWFAGHFVCASPMEALAVLRREGQQLNPLLWNAIAQRISADKPGPEVRGLWIPVLIDLQPSGGGFDFLEYILHASNLLDDEATCLLLFEHLTSPVIVLKQDFWHRDGSSDRDGVSIEVGTVGDDYWLRESWEKRLRPHLGELADKLFPIVTSNLQHAYLLFQASGKETPTGDPLTWSRGMIESTAQGSPQNGLGVLIDAARELLQWIIANRPNDADYWIGRWVSSGHRMFRRLAIFGVAKSGHWTADRKIDWLLENDLLYAYGYKPEVFLVLESAYPFASDTSRTAVLDRAVLRSSQAAIDDRTEHYETYNLLYWLTKVAPDCSLVSSRFAEIASKYPNFGPREHPDMDSWIGPVQWGVQSPTTVEELLSKSPEEQMDFLVSFKPEDPFSASREGLLSEVRKAVGQNHDWGMALADSLKQRQLWESDLWPTVVGGWVSADLTPAQWKEVLGFLLETDQVLTTVLHEAPRFLENGIAKPSNEIPDDVLDLAVCLSEKLWSVCATLEEKQQDDSDDWLTRAINHPAGILFEFELHVLSRLRKQSGSEWKEIPIQHKEFLSSVLMGDSNAAELGRVVVASQLQFIFALDEKWAIKTVLPLFDWMADPRRALQAWHGFLGWGRWNDSLLSHLMPYYEQVFPNLHADFPENLQRRFCEHLAGIACFSATNPVQHGLLDRFLTAVNVEERIMWASSVGPVLGQLKEPADQQAWDNWIEVYWQKRIEGIPVTLDAGEVDAMVGWSLHLQSSFPEVVTKICDSPAFKRDSWFIFYQLSESALLNNHPSSVAKLVLHLLQYQTFPFHAIDKVVAIVRKLAASDTETQDLVNICNELARLGYGDARNLVETLEEGV